MDAILRPLPVDELWPALHDEARAALDKEPQLFELLSRLILDHDALESALACNLAGRLSSTELTAARLELILGDAFAQDPTLGIAAQADLLAIKIRDPACKSYLTALLHFGGFLGLQAHRVAHWLWQQDRRHSAFYLQGRVAETFGIDIHPAASIGTGIMIDHGAAVVIGETAVVEDGVSMLHEVTLGGRGKASGDRHPKVRRGVSIGAGAKILGNIEIGAYARVGAGSVVLSNVPSFTTVVGIPARVVSRSRPSSEEISQVARIGEASRHLTLQATLATAPAEGS
jgi:serine O-acetyltransferase